MGVFKEYMEENPIMVEVNFRDFLGNGMRRMGNGLYGLSNKINPKTPDLNKVKWIRDLDEPEVIDRVASLEEFKTRLRRELQSHGFDMVKINKNFRLSLPKYGREDRIIIRAISPEYKGLKPKTFLWNQYKDAARFMDEVLSFLSPLPEEEE